VTATAKEFHSKNEWFEWAKGELHNLEKAKSDIIRTLAEALEKLVPVDMISEEISRELCGSGFISPSYVRFVLDGKYKNKKKQTSISKSGETILLNRDNNSAGNDLYSKKDFSLGGNPAQNTESKAKIHFNEVEVEMVEFDLKQALEMGLRKAIVKCQKSKRHSWILKMCIKDGLVKLIESEMNSFRAEDSRV
jgi:hypothetical protein